MALSKIDTAGLVADAVDNTILDLAGNYAFTGTVTGAGEITASTTAPTEGGSATTNVVQGLAKAWFLFDQRGSVLGANTIGDSLNITSIADTSTGLITVNIANDMNNTTYCPTCSSTYAGNVASQNDSRYAGPAAFAAGSYKISSQFQNSGQQDAFYTSAVHGDLA